MDRSKPSVTVLAGPTASGKSALAIMLAKKHAQKHNGVIINADSMQVYQDLQVLSARPSEAEMQGVPHFLYGHVDAAKQYSTVTWLEDINALLASHDAPHAVIVGGTGLYFAALDGMLAQMPQVPDDIRQSVRARLAQEGAEALFTYLKEYDPEAAQKIEPSDGQRLARAVEMIETTGEKFSQLQNSSKLNAPLSRFNVARIILEPQRALLHERIETRFEQMVDAGALDEVERLLARNLPSDLTVLKAIGVPQLAAYIQGVMSKDEAIEKSIIATRQYAKRQSTWFRNQMGEEWRRISSADELVL